MAEKRPISPDEKRRIQEMVAKSGEEYAPHNYIVKPHVVPQSGCYKYYCTRCHKYGHLHHQCPFVFRRQPPATSQASKPQKKADSALTVSSCSPQTAGPELQVNKFVPKQNIFSKFSISYKPKPTKLAEQVKDNFPAPSTIVSEDKQKSTNQKQTVQSTVNSAMTQVRSNAYPTFLTTKQPLAAAAESVTSPSTIGNFPLQSSKTVDKQPEIPLTQDNAMPPQTHYGYYTSEVGFSDHSSLQLYHEDPHVYYDQHTWPQDRYSTFADAHGRQNHPGAKWHGYKESGYPYRQNFHWHRPPRERLPQDRDYQSQRDWEWRHDEEKYRHQQEQRRRYDEARRRNEEARRRYNEMHKRYYAESRHPEKDPRSRDEPRFQGMKYRHHDEETGSHDQKPRQRDQESKRHDEPRSDQERCYDKGHKGYDEGSYRRYREGGCTEDKYDQQRRQDYDSSGPQEDRQ